jgi:hypothetical protein
MARDWENATGIMRIKQRLSEGAVSGSFCYRSAGARDSGRPIAKLLLKCLALSCFVFTGNLTEQRRILSEDPREVCLNVSAIAVPASASILLSLSPFIRASD